MDIKRGKKMNKYQEALKIMCNGCSEARKGGCDGFNDACHSYAPLKELVDKATPIKPIKIIKRKLFKDGIDMTLAECPECNAVLVKPQSICLRCYQKIEWKKEE